MLNCFQILSISHRRACYEQLKMLGLSRSENLDILREISKSKYIMAMAVIYTSKRVEFHFISPIRDKYLICLEIASALAQSKYRNTVNILMQFEHYWGDNAVRHSLRTVCGLESEKLGEMHIASQIRRAYNESAAYRKNILFHRLMIFINNQENIIRKFSGLSIEQKSASGIIWNTIKAHQLQYGVTDGTCFCFWGQNNISKTVITKLGEKGYRDIISIDSADELLSYSGRIRQIDYLILSREISDDCFRVIAPNAVLTISENINVPDDVIELISAEKIRHALAAQAEELRAAASVAEKIIETMDINSQMFVSSKNNS